MIGNFHQHRHEKLQSEVGVAALVRLVVVLFVWGLCGNAWAGSAVDTWRSEASAIRVQAENDAPAAYRAAEHLQATLPKEATPIDRARLLNLLSRIEVYLALTDRAAMHAQQALDLAKQHADKVGQVEADLNVALNAVYQGKLDAMVAAVTDSMEAVDGINRPDLLAESMLRTAMMYRRQGQFDDSVTMAMQTMEVARHSNDAVALTLAHQGMALSYDQSGRMLEAQGHYVQMREQARAAHMLRLEADAVIGLGRVDNRLGHFSSGEQLTREAVAMYRKTGNPFSITFGLYALAENLHRQGRTAASLPVLNEAVAIYDKYPNKIGLWWALDARSTYNQLLGHANAARVDAERAYAVAKSIGFPIYLHDSAKRLAAIVAEQGNHRRAYALLAETNVLSERLAQKNAGIRMLTLAKRYALESKQRQINKLNLYSEKQTAELHQQSLQFRWLGILVFAGFSILSITIFLFLRLRQSHHHLQLFQRHQQAILDAIPDLMFELGLDGRYYDCHSLHPELLAAPMQELLGKTVSDVLPQDAAEVCLAALREAHEKGTSTGKEYSISLPQGVCWFELSVASKSIVWGEEPHFIMLSRDITERKRLEATLYEREREFRTLAENSPDNIARYDLQCRLRYINPQLEKTLGVAAHDMLGITPNEVCNPLEDNYDEYQAKIKSVLSTGQGDEIELTFPDTGEGERYHHVRFVAEREMNGEIVGVLAIGRDITESRRTERLLLNLSNAIPGLLGAYRIRPDGSAHQMYASPGIYDIFGVTFDEVKDDATPRLERIHPDDLHASQAIMAEAVRTMTPSWNEYRVNHPTKGEIWLETHAVPVREGDGSIIWYGYTAEVTERRRLQDALKEREREFRTLAENSPDLVARFDVHCRYMYCNPPYLKMVGQLQAEVIGRTPVELRDDEVIRRMQATVEEVLRTGHAAELVQIMPSRRARKTYDHVRFTPEFDEFGAVISVLAVGRDVSEIKAVERQLLTLIENLPDFVVRLDKQARYLYVSPALTKAYGLLCDHFIGKTIVEAGLTGDMVSDITLMDAALSCAREGILVMREMVFRHPSGDRVFDIMYVPERDELGQVESVLSVARDITGMRTAHHALQAKEALLRALIDSIPDLIFFKDTDSVYLGFNQAFAGFCGYQEAELVGKTDYHFTTREVAEAFRQHDREMLASGITQHNDEWVIFPDGREALLNTMKTPLVDASGAVIGVIGVSRDITERYYLEQELIKREREFRTLAESAPDCIARYDHESRTVYINPALEHALGLSMAEVMGKRVDEIFPHVEVMSRYQKVLEQVIVSGKPAEFEMESQSDGDEHVFYNLIRFAPEFDADGHVVGAIAIGHDYTEQKRLALELMRREREFRTLAENAPDNIARYDHETRMVYINPVLLRTHGWVEGDGIGKRIDEIFPKNEAILHYQKVIEQVIASGLPATFEMVSEPVGGDRALYDLIRLAPEFDEAGNVIGAIGIGRDITEYKRLEQALIKREREFRTLAENSPSVIVRYDLECRRIYVNRTYLELNPHGANVVLGSTPLEFWNVLSLTAEEYMAHLRNIMATGKPDELLVELLDPEGLIAYHMISLVPEFDEHGLVMGVLSICHDITYIKHIEAMLRKSELEFRTLAENSPEMIVRYDHDCRRVYINPAYGVQTGIPIKDAWNKTPDDVWKPNMSRQEYVMRIQQVMDTGEPDQILLEWQGADGEMVSHLMHAVAEYDEHGDAVGVLVIGHNITKLKFTERQLEESQHMLRLLAARSEVVREDERKSLAREVHDELGQYLMGLRLSMVALGVEFGKNNPTLQEKNKHIIGLVDSTIQVVRNVVASLRPKALDIGMVSALEWLLDEYQERTKILCRLDVCDEAIQLDDKRATAVFRIVQESLTNISRHAEASQVEIRLHRHENQYVLQVRDNGKGFDCSVRKDKSFGLVGMQERAYMLGGKVEISSELGQGTMIKVYIPVNDIWSEGN